MNYSQKYKKYEKKYLKIKEYAGRNKYYNMDPITRISIQNKRDTPWLDWIEQGIKKYEGRLNRRFFSKIEVGDQIIWYDNNGKEVKTKVIELKKYKDFVEAFEDLGEKLVPINKITNEQVKNFYNKNFSDDEIKESGVVAIGIQVINN